MTAPRYRKTAKPGLAGKSFKLKLSVKGIPPGTILTDDVEFGRCFWVDKSEGNMYYLKLVTQNLTEFVPPELLKANLELHVHPAVGGQSDNYDTIFIL